MALVQGVELSNSEKTNDTSIKVPTSNLITPTISGATDVFTRYYKIGETVRLNINIQNVPSSGTVLFTLPSGYHPMFNLYVVASNGSFFVSGVVNVLTSGVVQVKPIGNATEMICFITFDAAT